MPATVHYSVDAVERAEEKLKWAGSKDDVVHLANQKFMRRVSGNGHVIRDPEIHEYFNNNSLLQPNSLFLPRVMGCYEHLHRS